MPTTLRTPLLLLLLALLPLAVPPARADNAPVTTLWQVGRSDGGDAEFALAPDRYGEFSEDGFYAVGRSDSRQAWPYVQPGPADGWAGGRPHDFVIAFGLRQAPAAPCRLVVRLLDTQAANPPRVRVRVNGFAQETQTPPGGGDASISGRASEGKPFAWNVVVPPSALHAGANLITISTVSGSWMVYDSVSFEAPPGVESAPVSPVWVDAVQAQPVLVRGAGGALRQVVAARARNFGPPTAATLRLNGAAQTVSVAAGVGQIQFLAPQVLKETAARLAVEVGGATVADAPVTLRPVRHWTVYLLPHSHVDVGYTQPQEAVRRRQVANLRQALDLIRRTANYPPDARFKWNLEVLWPIDSYLRDATPAQRREVFDALRSGALTLNAYYGNLLTGLCSPDELLRACEPSLRVAGEAGVPLVSAMQDDTPGYTWGNVTALSQAGVRFWSLGPNNGDRMGRSLLDWHDRPYYWVSPSGREKVLCWMTYGGYALAQNVGKRLGPFLPGYLDGLDRDGYPYDVACLHWCANGDNGPPDEDLPATVRDWNAAHAFPHLVIAGTAEPFVALEQRYAAKIPSCGGDFTPYWEDGAASTARETALHRNATDRLVQDEALWAMAGRPDFPGEAFRAAWEDALLYGEHTWGAAGSIDAPDAPFVKSQWAYKQAFALRADAASRALTPAQAPSGGGAAAAVDVFNTCSWTRTDLALVPAAQSGAGDRVVDAVGRAVPSQRLAGGDLAILVRALPPYSARRLFLRPGPPAAPPAASGRALAHGIVAGNGALSVRVDPRTGAVADLRAAGLPGNLVDGSSPTAVNDYFYLPGGELRHLARSGPATITVENAGPLVATLRVESVAPGARRLVRRVRLTAGLARVDLLDTVDKAPVRDKEGVHLGFGFRVPDPVMRLDMPLSVVRPERDQFPGANRNWYPVQHWVDVSNRAYGVTWATVDAPLIEVGGVTANLPGLVSQTDPRWLQRVAPSATFYSWVMNNHWHTNYKADQEGPVTFRYALAPHGVFAPDAAARFGQGVSRPLLALPAWGRPPTGSLLRVSPPGVTVAELKPSDDGRAWIVRLWGASGRDQSVRLTWQGRPVTTARLSGTAEGSGPALGPPFRVPGYGLVTLRLPRLLAPNPTKP